MEEDSSKINVSDQPLVYIVAPLVVILCACALSIIFLNRNRRRRGLVIQRRWPREQRRDEFGHVHVHHYRRPGVGLRHVPNRWTPWDQSDEGLNELGEAPPPYQPKKQEGVESATADGAAAIGSGSADTIRDMEEGRPPEYLSEPRPAVTTEGSRVMYR